MGLVVVRAIAPAAAGGGAKGTILKRFFRA
jgi:hypothetical protein